MPPSSRWIAVGAAVSIALAVYGLFALYDMAREDALTRVASLTTDQADATAAQPEQMRGPESGDTMDNGETDAAVGRPPEPESTVAAVPEPAEDDLTSEEGQATTAGDSPTEHEVPSSAASDEQAESTAEAEATASDEDPAESSAGPPESEDSARQPEQVETPVPAERSGEVASPPEEAPGSSAAEDEATAPPAAAEPELAHLDTETAAGAGGEVDPTDSRVAQQDEVPASVTTVVAEPAEDTPPPTAESETGDAPDVAAVAVPVPEPAAPPEPVEQEDAGPALAEAEATPAEPREDKPPPTAESETGDAPEVAPVVAAAPEPAAAPDPAVPQDGEPPLAEPEATPAEPGEDTPSATAGSDTGDVPDVAAVVVPVPEPATPPAPAVPQDENPPLAEAEATPAEPAEERPPATAGSETGDVPDVAAVVVPVPGPATPTAPAVPQGEDPSSAEVEAPPAEPAEDTPPPTASTETGDVPDVDPVVAPALEPAAPPESVDQEDAGFALAEAEAIPTEPAEETPSSTARSETGDAPEVAPVVAAAPEPAAPPVRVEQEDARPALAEAEATPAEPREDTPPPTAESETGDAPDVAAVVVPVPEPATPPALAVPQDEEPALAEGEASPAELAKVSASAPSTDGSERTADQEEPVTTPVSEAPSADVAATEQAVSSESPDIAPAVPADGPGPDDGASTEAPAAQQVAALPEAPADATAPDPEGAAAPEESLPAPESMAPPTPEDVAQFDVVQVSPDGTVVVAGRTVPGSQVELVVDGEVIATADTNRNGEFVFVPDVQLLPGVRELSIAVLSPDVPDRRTASRIVVVLIPDREMLAARVTEPTESAPSEAPIALLIDEQGETVGVIQPSPSMADPDTVLSLTTVTFDEDGYASITGGGEAGQKVTVYLDNEATGSTIIGENGYWTVRTQHPLAKTGSYKVRIDQTAPNDDTVTERIVTTLIRAGGKLIPAAATVVTVVKGNTLWGISRRHYGRGILYTLIYDSNSYQIADPHWIYPGQKFLIPKRN